MTEVRHQLLDRGDGAVVELFQAGHSSDTPRGALLLVHGNQGGRLVGAREIAENGTLARFAAGLNITAAAVSQPGFGASDGPPDFSGPNTQRAIIAALDFLKNQETVDPENLILYGNSRGAVASAMVATKFLDLRGLILSSGVYDLKNIYQKSPRGIQLAFQSEAGLSAEAFRDRSALLHADKIRCETLLLHGEHDDRAPLEQAEMFFDALIEAGTNVSLSVLDCGHFLPRNHLQTALRPFLERAFGRKHEIQ
jgi:dipeptidyl aminopeptidase/acylaminoacyl peptidase